MYRPKILFLSSELVLITSAGCEARNYFGTTRAPQSVRETALIIPQTNSLFLVFAWALIPTPFRNSRHRTSQLSWIYALVSSGRLLSVTLVFPGHNSSEVRIATYVKAQLHSHIV